MNKRRDLLNTTTRYIQRPSSRLLEDITYMLDTGDLVNFQIPGGLTESERWKAITRQLSKYTKPIADRRREEVIRLIDETIARESNKPELSVSGIIIPEGKGSQGVLVRSASIAWMQIVEQLQNDWVKAYEIPPQVWEEIIAGAYKNAGFDEVVLTPRSGDFGRDVIAMRHGVGCIKIIGSVKAYKPGHLVGYDDVRALLGVMSGERDASKGIITTTSDFPPKIMSDPFIAPFVPYRLELMNGEKLQDWLKSLLADG